MNLLCHLETCGAKIRRFVAALDMAPTGRLVALLVVVFAGWRFCTLDFIEKSGDAVWKWNFLRYYAFLGEWHPVALDHHQGRWALNLPVLGLIKLFGDDPLVYYLYPLLTALGAGLMLFFITARLGGKAAGVGAFLLFLLFPLTVRESTQFLPMLPAAFYMLCAVFFMLRHAAHGGLAPVFAAGIFVLLAYGCKFTSLYWAGAFALYLSLWPAKGKGFFRVWKFHITPAVLLFCATILVGLALETALWHHFFGITGGRAQVILGAHLKNRPNPEYLNFFEYLFSFLRPLHMSGKYFDFLPQVILFVVTLALLPLWLCREGEKRFIAFSFLTVYLLHTYMVYKFFPFLHPEKAHGRYFLLLAVVGMAIFAAGWRDGVAFLQQRNMRRWHLAALQAAILFPLLLLMLIRAGNQWSRGETPWNVFRVRRDFETARREKLPVLSRLQDSKKFESTGISSRDYKYGSLWLTFWGPPERLPLRKREMHLYRDARGGLFELLLNEENIKTGAPVRALLLDETSSRIAPLELFPGPTVEPKQ